MEQLKKYILLMFQKFEKNHGTIGKIYPAYVSKFEKNHGTIEKIYPAYVSKFEKNHATIEKIYPAYVSKQLKLFKASYSFNNAKRKKMELSCSKKTISIIKRNNV